MIPFRTILPLSILALSLALPGAVLADPSAADGPSVANEIDDNASAGVQKVARGLKTRPREPVAAPQREDDPGGAGWRVLQKNENVARARFVGSWDQVRAGTLADCDFRPIAPPDLAAGLGLATVYKADTAGWFLSTGRFIHVKTTDSERGFPTFSYESLARLGWAVGVTSGAIPSARVLWSAGPDGPIDLADLIERAVGEAHDAGAWIVAGHVAFSTVRGQSLRRAPALGVPLNGDSNPSLADRSWSLPVENGEASGMIAALVVDPAAVSDKPVVRTLAERFFGTEGSAAGERHLMRTHYGLFAEPSPPIDPSLPVHAVWNAAKEEDLPKVETVRQALDGARVARGHLAVWSIDSLEQGFPYRRPELVEIASVDPTILIEHRWATSDNFLGKAIYERPRALLVPSVAQAVARVNARLGRQGFRLKIYDAYRPLSVTQRLWLTHPFTPYLAAPNRGSRHNRGAAVDCTMTDMSGREVEMPSGYTVFDETAHRDYAGMSAGARRNLDILTAAMEAEGFTAIREEWWHFDGPGWESCPVADVPLWPGPEDETPEEPPLAIRNSDRGEDGAGDAPADADPSDPEAGFGPAADPRQEAAAALQGPRPDADRPAVPYGAREAVRTRETPPSGSGPAEGIGDTRFLYGAAALVSVGLAFLAAFVFAILRR